jgi:hypothetical protein
VEGALEQELEERVVARVGARRRIHVVHDPADRGVADAQSAPGDVELVVAIDRRERVQGVAAVA